MNIIFELHTVVPFLGPGHVLTSQVETIKLIKDNICLVCGIQKKK